MTLLSGITRAGLRLPDADPQPELGSDGEAQPADRRLPRLLGLGTAVPQLACPQAELAEAMARLWQLSGVALDRWHRIVAGSGIDNRHGVLYMPDAIALTTAHRMALYEECAPPLAAEAAEGALRAAGVTAPSITDLIVVSCTGFSAPGVDVGLVERLGLGMDVQRSLIGFMGCFGAINGLRAAAQACAARRRRRALLVAVELCSLHMRSDASPQNLVASALFADGAAAAVIESAPDEEDAHGDRQRHGTRPGAPLGCVGFGTSLLLPHGRDWMTWRITDQGFAMTLSREVPRALRESLRGFVAAGNARGEMPVASFAIHPGGPGVLDAADAALGLDGGRGIECSRDVLRRFGNMSSATVLFVLRDLLERGLPLPALLLAFGPGLSIESVAIQPRGNTG